MNSYITVSRRFIGELLSGRFFTSTREIYKKVTMEMVICHDFSVTSFFPWGELEEDVEGSNNPHSIFFFRYVLWTVCQTRVHYDKGKELLTSVDENYNTD